MKRIVITIIALLSAMNTFAQSDCFVHKVYDPLEIELWTGMYFDFDITGDSIPEFYFEQYHDIIENGTLNGWKCCTYNPEHPEMLYTYQDLDIAFDDDSMDWGSYFTPYLTTPHESFPAIYLCKEAMRLQLGDDRYYGWWNGTVVWGQNGNPILTLRESCYCTIPNYPLHWGQTSFDWVDIEENESTACANVYPNPTTGNVTVTGKDLKQAEVLNTLGQRVATAVGEGETLQVDLSGLPAGVYFVNVTDSEGRKCTRKVVKE